MKMLSRIHKVNINNILAEAKIVVEVKGFNKFRIKLIIARILIWLACLVMGFGLEFKNDRAGCHKSS